MSDGNPITIDLELSRISRPFGSEDTLWAPELKRILLLLSNHRHAVHRYEEAQSASTEKHRDLGSAPILSIAIFGPSGSGKSSLLRTLMHLLNRGSKEALEAVVNRAHDLEGVWKTKRSSKRFSEGSSEMDRVKALQSRIYSLEVLQPDKFQETHEFLYAFLANALTEERRFRERRQTARDWQGSYKPEALSPVQQSFQKMSEYLRALDQAAARDSEHDPLGISLDRLESHTSGFLLNEGMRQFINALTDALAGSGDKPSLLLLPVDDADLAPEQLLPILRKVQSYLLHPRLVPIFTFTDRAAEEILRNEFEQHVGDGGRDRAPAGPKRGSRRLSIDEHLAIQYLARSFPVRNRIRLGPAPARLRKARYKRYQGNAEVEGDVRAVLDAAALLLFGVNDDAYRHELIAALRPSTLRRQIHAVDEMVAAGVEKYVGGDPPAPRDLDLPWVQVFDRAAWALMNVHRDVLREHDLNLEDLYSWSSSGLRRMLLATLLGRSKRARRTLVRRWTYRVDSRRAQTLSLLAANVFRPWIPGEEPEEEEHYLPAPKEAVTRFGDGADHEGDDRIAAGTGFIWFVDLVLGFYLPQVLARDEPPAERSGEADPELGVGWNLRYGAVTAIRSANRHHRAGSLGMVFIDPGKFNDALKPWDGSGEPPDLQFHLRFWFCLGFEDDHYWAAVSFWRGLSLMALLLRERRAFELKSRHYGDDEPDEDKWKKKVRRILTFHLATGLVPGSVLGEEEGEGSAGGGVSAGQSLDHSFPRWRELATHLRTGEGEEGKKDFIDKISDWSRVACSELPMLVDLMTNPGPEASWRDSFVRRVHGAEIVGDFMPRLHATYIERPEADTDLTWSAEVALKAWTGVLLEHWRGVPAMQILLRSCPLLLPFMSDLSEEQEKPYLGDAVEQAREGINRFRDEWKPQPSAEEICEPLRCLSRRQEQADDKKFEKPVPVKVNSDEPIPVAVTILRDQGDSETQGEGDEDRTTP